MKENKVSIVKHSFFWRGNSSFYIPTEYAAWTTNTFCASPLERREHHVKPRTEPAQKPAFWAQIPQRIYGFCFT